MLYVLYALVKNRRLCTQGLKVKNVSDCIYLSPESKARVTNIRSEGFFTYFRGAYTNFLHDERKMRRLFFARRAYSTHFTRRVKKTTITMPRGNNAQHEEVHEMWWKLKKCLCIEKTSAALMFKQSNVQVLAMR